MCKSIEVIVLPLFDLEHISTKKRIEKVFNPKEFFGVSSSSKDEIEQYLANSKRKWE